MKINGAYLVVFAMLASGYALAQETFPDLANQASISVTDYVIAVVVGILGNFVHVVKKQLRGESDKVIIQYISTYSISFAAGLIVAAIVVLGEGALLFQGDKGYIFTAFLTGYTADSIFGRYTTPQTSDSASGSGSASAKET